MNPSSSSAFSSRRGSALVVALILCAIIGISLASYLQLSRTQMTVSNRALYNNAAMNLAENGLEEVMYSINRKLDDDTYDWSGWQNNGVNAWRRWTGYTFDGGAKGSARVYVYNYLGVSAPRAVARATIEIPNSSISVEKWVEIQLRKTSKFANGLVAKSKITFKGDNVTIDSWDSDPGDTGLWASAVPYSSSVRKDNGSVGCISVSVSSVLTQNADVWGFVATGGDDPTDDVGPKGSILGKSSPSGTKVDPTRVSTDFTAAFDPVTAPSATYYNIGEISADNDTSRTLPRTGDSPAADGNYYYSTTQIDLKGTNKNVLQVNGKVILKLTNSASNAITLTGSDAAISIGNTGSLAIYTEGDVAMAGKGVANGTDTNGDGSLTDSELNQPIRFQLYGTKPSGTQNISISGNGAFSGVVYAPQGSVTVVGNGTVSGSVVANDITMTGNANFHYDESLSDFGGANPFRVSKWREITSATDRAALNATLSFE